MIHSYCQWRLPESTPDLSAKYVHIWRLSFRQPLERVRQLAETLSRDEVLKAERFHFRRHWRRFIVRRVALRTILGHYLGIKPGEVQFRYSPDGKPYLTGGFESGGLRFNTAHSYELGLQAFTCEREIGIDLEYIRPVQDATEIATRFFSTYEKVVFRMLPGNQQLQAFHNCWTRKEAYLKATGDGLTRPLDQFGVSLAPGDPAKLLFVEGDPREPMRWSLQALAPAFGYVGAIAVQGHDWQLRCWQWTWPKD